jgi:hypothetical protein
LTSKNPVQAPQPAWCKRAGEVPNKRELFAIS